jgi:hypothetical protein
MVGICRLNYNEPTSAMEINHISYVLGYSLGMALVLLFPVGCFFQEGAKCGTPVCLFLIIVEISAHGRTERKTDL